MRKQPSFQFYPKDWLADGVASCSLAAQGLWLRLMLIMHESPRYGYLCFPNGDPIQPANAARLCGCSEVEYDSLTAELTRAGVPSMTSSGITFSRRMVRDEKIRKEWRLRQGKHRNNNKLSDRDVTHDVTRMSRGSSSSSSNLNTTPPYPPANAGGNLPFPDRRKMETVQVNCFGGPILVTLPKGRRLWTSSEQNGLAGGLAHEFVAFFRRKGFEAELKAKAAK